VVILSLLSLSFFAGMAAWKFGKPKVLRSAGSILGWVELRSGWSRDLGDTASFAAVIDGDARWWVKRDGVTVRAGLAASLDDAKRAAENEARGMLH